eukprot:6490963-Amphidinium_carterae.1
MQCVWCLREPPTTARAPMDGSHVQIAVCRAMQHTGIYVENILPSLGTLARLTQVLSSVAPLSRQLQCSISYRCP